MLIYTRKCSLTNEIFYIGRTATSLKSRLQHAKSDIKRKLSKGITLSPVEVKMHSIYKQGGNVIIELIDEIDDSEDYELLETYWIDQFKSWGCTLYNVASGSCGGKPKNEGTNVNMFSLEGVLIKSFKTVKDAAAHVTGNSSVIINVCNGKKYQAYGYRWSYTEITTSKIKYKRVFNVFKCNGELIHRCSSTREAESLVGVSITNITKCLSGYQESSGGYIFSTSEKVAPIRYGGCYLNGVYFKSIKNAYEYAGISKSKAYKMLKTGESYKGYTLFK